MIADVDLLGIVVFQLEVYLGQRSVYWNQELVLKWYVLGILQNMPVFLRHMLYYYLIIRCFDNIYLLSLSFLISFSSCSFI